MAGLSPTSIKPLISLIASASRDVINLDLEAERVPDSVRHAQVLQLKQICHLMAIVEKNAMLHTSHIQATLQSIHNVISQIGKDSHPLVGGEQDPPAVMTPATGEQVPEAAMTAQNLRLDRLQRLIGQLTADKVALVQDIKHIDSSLLSTMEADLMSFSDTSSATSERDAHLTTPIYNTSVISSSSNVSDSVLLAVSEIEQKVTTVAEEVAALSAQLRLLTVQSSDQLSITETAAHHFRIPNRRNANFVGRSDVLDQLERLLCPQSDSISGLRTAVIRAMGGQGKSQIALHFCFNKRLKPFTTILWIDATSENSLKSGLHLASDMLKTKDVQLEDNVAKEKFIMDLLSSNTRPWLLVFDNFDEADYRLQDYFPESCTGSILVTSRNAVTQDLVSEADAYIELEGLARDNAVDLLYRVSGTYDRGTYPTSTWAIVERLGYHPLAITQAGSYIKRQRIRIDQFMEHYNARRRRVLDSTPALTDYRRRLTDVDQERALNVMTTTELSLQQLQRQDPDGIELELLTAFSFLDKQGISERLFQDARHEDRGVPITGDNKVLIAWLENFYSAGRWSSASYVNAVQNLADLSLVQNWELRDDGFVHATIHPLIQDYMKLRCEQPSTQVAKLWLVLGSSLHTSFDYKDADFSLDLSDQQDYIRHIHAQTQNHQLYLTPNTAYFATLQADEVQRARYWCGIFMDRMWQYDVSVATMASLLVHEKRRAKERGPPRPSSHESQIMNGIWYHLAQGYRKLGRLDLTKHYLLETMAWYKLNVGNEEVHYLRLKQALAVNAMEMGELKYAETLLLEVIDVANGGTASGLFPPGHDSDRIHQANSARSMLGKLYLKRGKWAKSEHYARKAIEGHTIHRGPAARNTLESRLSFATSLTAMHRYEEAVEQFSIVREAYVKIYNPDHRRRKEVEKMLEHARYQLLAPIRETESTEELESDEELVQAPE